MKVYIDAQDSRWKKYKIDFPRAVRAAARLGGAGHGAEVSIILTDDAHIHELNKQYRNIDRPTNVLSFELGDPQLLGDIYISYDTVMREAGGDAKKFIDHAMHMAVHGTLHLLGYDHIDDDDAIVMQEKEIAALHQLGIENPYAEGDEVSVGHKQKIFGYALYFLGGAMAALGYAPVYFWPATIVGIGLAYWLTIKCGRGGFFKSMLHVAPFGAGYAVAMFWWMLHSIFVVPELMHQFAIFTIPALLGIAIAGAIIFGIPFAFIRKFPGNHAQRPFYFAAAWTLVLWAREWMLTGFPWNPVANIALPLPWLSNSMSVWGALGLTFVLVGLTAAIVEWIVNRTRVPLIIFLGLLIGAFGLGKYNITRAAATDTGASPLIRIVQPARSQGQKLTRAAAQENLRHLATLASQKKDKAPDLIVFPETSYPFVLTPDDKSFPLASLMHTPMVVGALSTDKTRVYNSLAVVSGAGKIETIYHKSHLVPFGEYAPLGGILPSPGFLSPGNGPAVISISTRTGDITIAPAICYEIIFTDSIIPRHTHPAAIINITNDTWFGRTPGTYQHLDMVRRYAIESGVPIIRANYSGISAFVNTIGHVTHQLDVGVPGVLDGEISGTHQTLYRTIGRDGWMAILVLFTVLVTALLGRQKHQKD